MQEYEVPIDIHAHKLLDWLISRRICKNGWQEQALAVRQKINGAIQDMPEHEAIVKLLSGTYITYFNSVKIVEILKETEKDTKNIFGRYGSQRMKDWQDVVKQYEKNNMYLAEAAQILIRNLNYEIPGLKKHIAKCEQMQTDCIKKAAECGQRAVEFREEYVSLCRQFGIQGNTLKKEIAELVKELPVTYQKLAGEMKALREAQEFYEVFVKFTMETNLDVQCLPFLKYIIEHGNTTTYEWKYGEPPLEIEEPRANVDSDGLKPASEMQDSPDIELDDAIDFGDITLETGDIDWGVGTGETDNEANIPLDLTAVDAAGIVVEDVGMEGGVARGDEAMTILENPKIRTAVLNELVELEGFLEQRLEEMKGEEDILSFSQFQNAPDALQLQNCNQVATMLAEVQHSTASLTTKRMQHLYLIAASPRYVDRWVETLDQKLRLADKTIAMQQAAMKRKADAAEQAELLRPQLRLVMEKTKELQDEICQDVSRRCKNRPINIMGGATVLQ